MTLGALSLLLTGCGGSEFHQAADDASAGSGGASGSAAAGGGAAGTGVSAGGNADASAGAAGTNAAGAGAAGAGAPVDAAVDAIDAKADAADAAGTCSPACGQGRSCCNGHCVNLVNDPGNCGACGTTCGGAKPFCDGQCQAAPCTGNLACKDGSCCGEQCCAAGQICCAVEGPLTGGSQCHTPTAQQPTCPQGCSPLCVSDRAIKHAVAPVDTLSVLETVSKLPVSTWSYNSEGDGIRHMGPMAQDFKAAFGLGDTDKAYNPVDAHGVALAAIQALYELNQRQGLELEQLQRENAELRARMTHLEQR